MREFAPVFTIEEFSLDETPIVHDLHGPWDDDEVIDTILRLVADHHRAVGAAIGRRSFSPTLAELRQSPLGLDLRLLAAAGHGDLGQERVRETAARVTDLLLRPLAAEGMVIPAWFWSTAIGRIVARAARSTYDNNELIPVVEAADRLHIDAELIQGWIADGAIESIPDEAGNPMLPREAVDHRRLVGRELNGWQIDSGEDVLVGERLAS